jgi:hypothetical protein
MGWTLPFTIGNLHLLWYWALEFAPTGDLTKFDPKDLTYDLDLGDSTPEQFLQALIECGFLDKIADKSEDVVLRLHDWPEYTAKSLRPKFRRNPERWHRVLRSYGLPVIIRTTRRRDIGPSALPSKSATMVEYESPGAVRVDCVKDAARDQKVGMALRAVRRISTPGSDEHTAQHASRSDVALETDEPSTANTEPVQQPEPANAPIPKSLSGRRNFNDWWLKLQECYQSKGCPLTAYEQTEILAMLTRNPFSAVDKLKYSVANFETSYANLLAPQKLKSSVEHGPTGGSG